MINLEYLYNPAAAKPYFDKNYFVDKELGFQVIENGMILPNKKFPTENTTDKIWGFGGIVDQNNNYIKGSFVMEDKKKRNYPPPPPN